LFYLAGTMSPGPARLYMILLGCRPKGRNTEQHDLFFTIADSLSDAKPAISAFWRDAGTIHIDAWRAVTAVDGYRVSVFLREEAPEPEVTQRLFFVNLGGYKPGEFEEFHYKMVVAAADKAAAIRKAKETAFYRHTGFRGAESHIDDKFGIDVDDVAAIDDILPAGIRERYAMRLVTDSTTPEDELHLGYLKWSRIQ
jgi:hypothetical protein